MYGSNFPHFGGAVVASSYDRINGNMSPYQNQFGYQNYPQQTQPTPPQTNITFVNGIEGAKAFQLSPNSNFLMMDSENSRFYVKTTDSLGIANISSYSFTQDEKLPGREVMQNIPANTANFATSEELQEIKASIQSLPDSMKNYATIGDLEDVKKSIYEIAGKFDEMTSKINELFN